MQIQRTATAGIVVTSLVLASGALASRELWQHPRRDPFDPGVHYRDAAGEIYYLAENDIQTAIGDIRGPATERPTLTVTLGADLLEVPRRSNGSLEPVFLWDSDGDGAVDRRLLGRIEGSRAIFESSALLDVDFSSARWQLGVRYLAGAEGDATIDGRYLASVDSTVAEVLLPEPEAPPVASEPEPLPPVAAPPGPPGLVIMKHQEDVPFDLARFIEQPTRYIENFRRLTRAPDADDWTQDGAEGRVTTHFDREDLFLVQTEGGAALEVEWGDMPLGEFVEHHLRLLPDADDCFGSLRTELTNRDGTPSVIPHRLYYCPGQSTVLFDAPDGYEITLSAFQGTDVVEKAELSTSVRDNVRLYVREVYPRSPSRRATGSVLGNVRAGFGDAGRDAQDVFRHALIGAYEPDIHTGQITYRVSPVVAPFRALIWMLNPHPFEALQVLFEGAASGVQAAADAMSAVDNAVLNPLLQGLVGPAASPGAADTAGDYLGAFTQAAVKNLPLGERSTDAVNPASLYYHDRGFMPPRYTRTDTQLNIDRAMTVLDLVTLGAIYNHNNDSGGGGGGGDGGNGGGPPGPPPGPPDGKVTLCHVTGVPKVIMLVVGDPAVEAHLAHGDFLGACN